MGGPYHETDDGDYEDTSHLEDAGWWPSEKADDVKEAIKALRSETLYENGKKDDGISVKFLCRLTMLEVAAEMRSWDDPIAVDARRELGCAVEFMSE